MDIPFLPPLEWISRPVAIVLALGFTVFQIAFLSVTAYLLISWPLRRRERTRWILDLLESGLRRGHSVSQSLAAPAVSGDRVFGYRYRAFAAELSSGATLTAALRQCPSLIHPRIASILSLGEQTHTLLSMVRVCRHALQDATERFRASRQYLMSFSLLLFPVNLFFIFMLRVFVFPKFYEMGKELEITLMLNHQAYQRPLTIFSTAEWIMAGSMLLLGVCLVGGPWILRFFRSIHAGLVDTLLWQLPWYRNRLLRDTTHSLALLLDSGMPESKALELTGLHQANLHMLQLTRKALERLQHGESLREAVAHWDARGELGWRMANAQRAHLPRLTEALQGWWSVLDARAFRQEQIAAQLLTCSFVVLNGWMVCRIAKLVFLPIIHILETMILW